MAIKVFEIIQIISQIGIGKKGEEREGGEEEIRWMKCIIITAAIKEY